MSKQKKKKRRLFPELPVEDRLKIVRNDFRKNVWDSVKKYELILERDPEMFERDILSYYLCGALHSLKYDDLVPELIKLFDGGSAVENGDFTPLLLRGFDEHFNELATAVKKTSLPWSDDDTERKPRKVAWAWGVHDHGLKLLEIKRRIKAGEGAKHIEALAGTYATILAYTS